jgi:hypothetical protein
MATMTKDATSHDQRFVLGGTMLAFLDGVRNELVPRGKPDQEP